MSGHPMCDDIYIFVCHMARVACCLKASSQGGSFPIVLQFRSANLLRNLLRQKLMDRKGESQTLEQQSELRPYTDHPVNPVSQNFPNLSFLIMWRLTDFLPIPKKDEVESKHVKKEESCKMLETSFRIFHVQE